MFDEKGNVIDEMVSSFIPQGFLYFARDNARKVSAKIDPNNIFKNTKWHESNISKNLYIPLEDLITIEENTLSMFPSFDRCQLIDTLFENIFSKKRFPKKLYKKMTSVLTTKEMLLSTIAHTGLINNFTRIHDIYFEIKDKNEKTQSEFNEYKGTIIVLNESEISKTANSCSYQAAMLKHMPYLIGANNLNITNVTTVTQENQEYHHYEFEFTEHVNIDEIFRNISQEDKIKYNLVPFTKEDRIEIEKLSGMITSLAPEETTAHQNRVGALTKTLQHDILISQGVSPDVAYFTSMKGFYAGKLHDIGKINLGKMLYVPRKFTKEERKKMEEHPVLGYKYIPKKPAFLEIGQGVLYHHENFKGEGGYPEGLIGKEIPSMARIISISDVYDALFNQRSYKNRKNHHAVLNIMMKMKDEKFDPEYFSIFMEDQDDHSHNYTKKDLIY